MESHEKCY